MWCSGLIPSIVGVAHVAIQFPLYEALKLRMLENEQANHSTLSPIQLVSIPFPDCGFETLAI